MMWPYLDMGDIPQGVSMSQAEFDGFNDGGDIYNSSGYPFSHPLSAEYTAGLSYYSSPVSETGPLSQGGPPYYHPSFDQAQFDFP